MRIAFFGGTFDPPHRGHIAVARAAANAFALDEVLFAPTGLQPLKAAAATTPFAQRLAMVEEACRVDERFKPSTVDAPREDRSPNFTIDTLIALQAARPNDTLFNLVGADAFLSVSKWRDPIRLLEVAEWIVVTRPDYQLDDLASAAAGDPLIVTAVQRGRVHVLGGVDEAVSATDLRARLRRGEPCTDLLSGPVAAYIRRHRLYA